MHSILAQTAMPPKQPLSQLGTIGGHAGVYRADLQYRDEQTNLNQHIRGPARISRRRADSDLARIRNAAAGCVTWAEAIASMHATELEIHQEAEKEARVAMGIDQYEAQRLAHKADDSEPETEGDDDDEDCVWAEDLTDPEVLERLFPKPAPKEPIQPKDANEATVQLSEFRFTQETPDTLRMLLSARADPNVVSGEGDLPPLMRAMWFSNPPHDHEYRDLLIQIGAKNGIKEKERWEQKQLIDRIDPIYVAKLRRSACAISVPLHNPRKHDASN